MNNRNTGLGIGGIIVLIVLALIAFRVIDALLGLLPLIIVIGLIWYFFFRGNSGAKRY